MKTRGCDGLSTAKGLAPFSDDDGGKRMACRAEAQPADDRFGESFVQPDEGRLLLMVGSLLPAAEKGRIACGRERRLTERRFGKNFF